MFRIGEKVLGDELPRDCVDALHNKVPLAPRRPAFRVLSFSQPVLTSLKQKPAPRFFADSGIGKNLIPVTNRPNRAGEVARLPRHKDFTDKPSRNVADWRQTRNRAKSIEMTAASVRLSDVKKLDVLRRLDHFREWHSLDEIRYCLACGNLITGQQIKVVRESDATEGLQVICPTEHCHSIPMDWVLPTPEILARASARQVGSHLRAQT